MSHEIENRIFACHLTSILFRGLSHEYGNLKLLYVTCRTFLLGVCFLRAKWPLTGMTPVKYLPSWVG